MELSMLYRAFSELVNLGEDDLLQAVEKKLFSDEKDAFLAGYLALVDGDLQSDELQKIFQYHYADRKEKCQDYTPKSIAELCASATETNGGGVVYDLCAGSGALTIQKWARNKNSLFICEELDERVIPFLLFNMAVRNMNGYIINRNALTLQTRKVYKVVRSDHFSDIEVVGSAPVIEADEIVSNPPYNIRWDAPEPLLADERFTGKPIPPASNANYAFVLTALSRMKDDGRCAFVLPGGVLSGDLEKEARSYLVDSGFLERVIMLPDRMFESTSIGTCVMVFSHGNQAVKMFDCRKKAVQEQRDQNGQYGNASHTNRTYHKIVNVLLPETIEMLCGICEDCPGFSREAHIDEIRANEYNLSPSRYISFEYQQQVHRPYADIMADINRIARERSVVKITVNETLAKQMGIYEVAQQAVASNDAQLGKVFSLLGGEYEDRRYITLSKAKNEFKVENQDKEFLSSLLQMFLPMWKQHIFYLNQEENRLLEELRDAMLPDLMSGNLAI